MKQGKKIFTLSQFIALTLLISALAVACTVYFSQKDGVIRDYYQEAVEDAMLAEPTEIYPLVCLTPEETKLIRNADGTRVLMTAFGRATPDFTGQDVRLVSTAEAVNFFRNNEYRVSDWDERFTKLLGLPLSDEPLVFTVLWVDPEEVMRPAYQTDPTLQMTEELLYQDVPAEYSEWFSHAILASYFRETKTPWTRLGYTYDWEDNREEYGLTEFLLLPGSTGTEVLGTVGADDYVDYLYRLVAGQNPELVVPPTE